MIVLASHVHFCLLMVTLVAAKFSDELFVMQLGYFRICLDVNDPFLIVTHMSDSTKVLFKTIQSLPFITIGYATDSRPPIVDGNFKVNEWTLFETPYQNIQEVQTEHQNEDVITGEVWGLVTQAKYKIRFYVPEDDNGVLLEHQLAFTINVTPLQGSFNRVFLNYWCDGKENFYGFGTQVV